MILLNLCSFYSGDGGNDCGALKAAHVGIALSDAEASVVAPFTSLDKTISSVTEVLREGRCALASALASYKFMIMVSYYTCLHGLSLNLLFNTHPETFPDFPVRSSRVYQPSCECLF